MSEHEAPNAPAVESDPAGRDHDRWSLVAIIAILALLLLCMLLVLIAGD